jgi:hypothetical protein
MRHDQFRKCDTGDVDATVHAHLTLRNYGNIGGISMSHQISPEREREINYPHLAETTNLGPTHG